MAACLLGLAAFNQVGDVAVLVADERSRASSPGTLYDRPM